MAKSPQVDPTRYEAQCAGKEKHASEEAALASLRFVKGNRIKHWENRRGFRLEPMNAYFCGFCAFWHLGHEK